MQYEIEEPAFCSRAAAVSLQHWRRDISSSSSCLGCTNSSICCSADRQQHICVATLVNIQRVQGDEAIGSGCTTCPPDHPQPAASVNTLHRGQHHNNHFRSARNLSCQPWQLHVFSFSAACSQICHPEHGNTTRGVTLGMQTQISRGLFPLGGSGGWNSSAGMQQQSSANTAEFRARLFTQAGGVYLKSS